MRHDSALESQRQLPVPSGQQMVGYLKERSQALIQPAKRRGKPATLTAMHLCLSIVLCGLEGFGAQ